MPHDDDVRTGGDTDTDVAEALRASWGLRVDQLLPLDGGMNSRTWRVRPALTADDSGRPDRGWVAKLVRSDQHDTFVRGLRAAALVQAAGIPAGAPVPTPDGADHVDLTASTDGADDDGGALALLDWVDGDPLTGHQPWEQTIVGATLGAAHRVLRDAADETAVDFPRWVDVDADHLDVQDWVRPAVRSALAATGPWTATACSSGCCTQTPSPEPSCGMPSAVAGRAG